jgi:glycosyltransferase involved in cell wall biosynthesis
VDMSIVLVCWNNKAYLDPCLKSLYEGGLKSTFDVIVVDNGSHRWQSADARRNIRR